MKKLAMIILVIIPMILVSLGIWQVCRYYEKSEINDKQQVSNEILTETEIEEQPIKSSLYKEVKLVGLFIDHKELHFLRYMEKQKGYFIYTPFTTPGGKNILINMGWIPDKDKNNPRDEEYMSTEIQGIIDNPFRWSLQFVDNDKTNNEWFYLRKKELEEFFDLELEDYVVVRNKDDNTFISGSNAIYYVSSNDLSRHISYALTWFSLAIIAGIMIRLRIIKS